MLLPQNCQPLHAEPEASRPGMSGDLTLRHVDGVTVALPSGSDQSSAPVSPLTAYAWSAAM